MVDVLLGSNPVTLIVAGNPSQTGEAWDAPDSVGVGLMDIVVAPVRSPVMVEQPLSSVKDVMVYVALVVGETILLKLVLPDGAATVPPPLLSVNTHAPVAETVPLIAVLPPLQMFASMLVILADGRSVIDTTALPFIVLVQDVVVLVATIV